MQVLKTGTVLLHLCYYVIWWTSTSPVLFGDDILTSDTLLLDRYGDVAGAFGTWACKFLIPPYPIFLRRLLGGLWSEPYFRCSLKSSSAFYDFQEAFWGSEGCAWPLWSSKDHPLWGVTSNLLRCQVTSPEGNWLPQFPLAMTLHRQNCGVQIP